MKIALLFLFLFPTYALDTGTGADGACTEATFVSGTRSYNCTTVTIGAGGNSAFKGQGGAVVIIRATSSVTINGAFDFGGANGADGATGDPVNGGAGGPGASSGGTCNLGGNTCGNTLGDNNGAGSGAGVGGRRADDPIFAGEASGGGGAGGSFGVVGTVGGTGPTAGGTAGTGGSVGSAYGAQSTWDTTFVAGSGGGAGGFGVTNGNGASQRGGAGGGGGGGVRIIAAGDITINGSGSIISPGGNGGLGQNGGNIDTDDGGCGGGGSGGAVWLQSEGNIINAGSITALGGNGNTCNAGNLQGGSGGAGGAGRIRLDDDDGVIANTGTINPTAVTNVVTTSTSGTSALRSYDGDIACGSISLVDDSDPSGGNRSLINFFSILVLGFLLGRFSFSRKFLS